MSTHSVSVDHPVDAPVQTAWEVLTDLDVFREVVGGIDSIEVLSPNSSGLGARWNETRTMMGKTVTVEMEVTAYDPPRSQTIRSETGGVVYTTVFTVTEGPRPGTSVIVCDFSSSTADPQGLSKWTLKVFGGLASKMVAKGIRKDLEAIGRHAEKVAGPASGSD